MSYRGLTILGCSSQQPTRHRNHGAYLLRWNGEGLLFDPGEGTQRQFIFANIAPTVVSRIFISHFHGDHCLGLGSMLMRLNLDKVSHPIHCYYPASGKKYFDRLRYSTIYHETINVIEHPISKEGLVEDFGNFRIEARQLNHLVDTLGWRITEPDTTKFVSEKIKAAGLKGPIMQELINKGQIKVHDRVIRLEDVSYTRKGDSVAIVADSLPCQAIVDLAKNARILLCESTYLEEHAHLAKNHYHMTAKQAAEQARRAEAQQLILTHFSARYNTTEEFTREAGEIFPNVFAAEEFRSYEFPKNSN
ncbi:ribonuclease Z [Chlamydia suis]|uniref:ribonuclease Z n=1 Tax=Chlamydia suis TaxID=83559 RepID=UPI0009B081CF|nr:ribonuclease Z [Chlamydia suis]